MSLMRTPASSPLPECGSCRQQEPAEVKLLQQNPVVLNWGCWLI